MPSQPQILVVEDDPHHLQATLQLLAEAGYQAVGAATNDDSLRLAIEHPPDLILLAARIPSTAQLLRRFKAEPHLAHTLILLLSSPGAPSADLTPDLKDAADAVITRPVPDQDLLVQVKLMLRLKQAEDVLGQRTHELDERVKELTCLYGISRLVENPDNSLSEILQATVELLPPSWQYPEITGARIRLDGQECQTENFRETAWVLASDIHVDGQIAGKVQVCYLEQRPEYSEGPFLQEERRLIDVIAERMGSVASRLRAEHAMRDSELTAKAILNAPTDAVVLMDPDGLILDANETMATKFSTHVRELIGTYVWDLFPPEVAERRQAIIDQVIRTGQAIRFQDERQGRWNDNIVYPILVSKGEVARIAVLASDITERQQMEKRLRESEERLRSTLASLDDLVFVLNEDGIFVDYYQPASAPGLYIPPEAFLGKSLNDVMPPGVAVPFGTALEALETTGQVQQFEYALPVSGQERWFSAKLSMRRDSQGNFAGVTVVSRDITAYRQAEEQIRASLNEKEVLLQEIHHRVKNNLQVISSLLDMQSLNVRDAQTLEILQDSQDRIRAMALVHQQLYQSSDLASIYPAEYIRGLAARLFGAYRNWVKPITFDTQVDDIALDINTAIPLGLIISELISNALKHAFPPVAEEPAGVQGQILVELHAQPDGRLALTVSDNGIGLPPGSDVRTASTLGLQLVYMLTQQLDGTLELDTSAGTTFKIIFPRSEPRR